MVINSFIINNKELILIIKLKKLQINNKNKNKSRWWGRRSTSRRKCCKEEDTLRRRTGGHLAVVYLNSTRELLLSLAPILPKYLIISNIGLKISFFLLMKMNMVMKSLWSLSTPGTSSNSSLSPSFYFYFYHFI